jgi:hypothetical protein
VFQKENVCNANLFLEYISPLYIARYKCMLPVIGIPQSKKFEIRQGSGTTDPATAVDLTIK